jgi:hypothetical protein
MKFSWLMYLITVALVCFEGIWAIREKTFSRKQVRKQPIRLTFLWHWGVVVGDLIILPFFNGLVIPYFSFPPWVYALFFLASLAITFYCHYAWWPTSEKALNFMCPDWEESGKDRKLWYKDATVAGYIHFVFMTLQLVVIFGYIFTHMPSEVVWRVCVIFLVFVPFGVIEPGVVEGWPLSKKKKLVTFGIAVALWAVVGVATWLKL